MPRPIKKKELTLVEIVEAAGGAVSISTVLELCKRLQAAELTIRAQREVIQEHARTIGELRKGKS